MQILNQTIQKKNERIQVNTSRILKSWLWIYINIYVFRCRTEGCGKSFTASHHLKAHGRTHSGARPHACTAPGCNRLFSTATSLKAHAMKHQVWHPVYFSHLVISINLDNETMFDISIQGNAIKSIFIYFSSTDFNLYYTARYICAFL